MKNIQYLYLLCVLMIMLFPCTAEAVSDEFLRSREFVYNIMEEETGKKTVAIFSYGYSGIVQGFYEPSNELVRVQIPIFEKLIIQDSTYTFFFSPIPPDTQTATLQLKHVVFEDGMYVKDASLCEDFRVLTFTINREKSPEEVMEIPSDVGWKYMDWYLPDILYREQTEENCGKVFGTGEQRYTNNEKPTIHLSELLGRPVNFQNLAESALYCYHHMDIMCCCFDFDYFYPLSSEGPAVLWATQKRDMTLVSALIKEGADVNNTDYEGGTTALQMAVWNHDTEIVKLLLEAGADVDVQESSWTPLTYAAFSGLTDIAKLLIEAGADLNIGNSLLHAVEKGHDKIALALIDAGVDVNSGNSLIHAIASGRYEVALTLINVGADVNVIEAYPEVNLRRTALLCAIEKSRDDVVQALINAGADVNARDQWEYTPLMLAARGGHSGMIQSLLNAGADINARNYYNVTPLMEAASTGRQEIVLRLIHSGADIHARNNRGENALAIAEKRGHQDIIKILKEAMKQGVSR